MLLNAKIQILFTVLYIGVTLQNGALAATEAEQVAKAFKDNKVVPDVIPVAPKTFLKISYGKGVEVNKGAELTPTQVQNQPKVEWKADPKAYYTLIKVGPDAPSRATPNLREVNHWTVVNIPGSNVDKGEVLAAYLGSGAPKDTGLHRYVFLLYKQSGKLKFNEVRVAKNSRKNRLKFSAVKFAKKYNLGTPVAGNFFQAKWDEYVPKLYSQISE